MPSLEPATGREWYRITDCTPAEVDQAVAAAQAALQVPEWGDITQTQRAGLIFNLAALIKEHAPELALLEARDNGKRETDEASSKLKADLAAEVLAHAEDQEKDKAKIEELTKKLDDKADEMAKCGDEDQAKYDALEAQLKEKMAEYEALHKKVCAMLGDFNLPSGNSAV